MLHLSDIHLMPNDTKRTAWLRSLADLEPDLVVNTGDNISHPGAIPVLVDALQPLLAVPGVFV
ncbi:MAG TPA: metallophosphoesterase, partial [Actinobacteria bacterium]|nr:metallophosphoesterase [Actinomycetota bacterium]